MAHVPVDAPRDRVIKALERLGFRLVREGNHIEMVRENPDGTRTPADHAQPSPDQRVDLTDYLDAGRDTPRRISGRL